MTGTFWQQPLAMRVVDFDRPLAVFRAALHREQDTRLVQIQAPHLSGKSSLCAKLRHIAQETPEWGVVCLDFQQASRYDCLSILLGLIDSIGGPSLFPRFQTLIDPHAQAGGGVNFGSGNVFLNSQFETIAGGSLGFSRIDVNDIVVQRRLTAAFVQECRQFGAALRPVVLSLDTFEQCPGTLLPWIIDMLIPALIDDLGGHFIIVIAGQRIPDLRIATSIEHTIYQVVLEPLTREHCREYIARVGLSLEDGMLDVIYRATRGQPSLMEMFVRNYVLSLEQAAP